MSRNPGSPCAPASPAPLWADVTKHAAAAPRNFSTTLQNFLLRPSARRAMIKIQLFATGGHGRESYGETEILFSGGGRTAGGVPPCGGGKTYAASGRSRHRGGGGAHGGHQPQCLLQIQGRGAALPEYARGAHHHLLRAAEGQPRRPVQLPVHLCQFRREYPDHQPDHPHQRLRRRHHLRRDGRYVRGTGRSDDPRRGGDGRAEIRDHGGQTAAVPTTNDKKNRPLGTVLFCR